MNLTCILEKKWRSRKMFSFGADLIWRHRKKIKFGADLIWRFQANCANCAKFSPRQKLSE